MKKFIFALCLSSALLFNFATVNADRAEYFPKAYINNSSPTIQVSSMAALKLLDITNLDTEQKVLVQGFYAGGVGGGIFKWDSTKSRTYHNGGTIIDPTHSSVPGVTAWYTAENATTGCYVKDIGESILTSEFGPIADGITDDTTPVQSAIDAAYYAKCKAVVNGTYGVTSIKCYGQNADDGAGTSLDGWPGVLEFAPDAKFNALSATFVLRTAFDPTTLHDSKLIRGTIIRPVIDMKSTANVGILLETTQLWNVESPDIRNVPGGTFNYDDGNGSGAYARCGICIKGITGTAGSFMNRITSPFIRGASALSFGNVGIWFGTSSGLTTQNANGNIVSGGYYRYLDYGVYIDDGCGNNTIEHGEFSLNGICVYINKAARTSIIKSYFETSTTGIEIAAGTNHTYVYEVASTGGGTVGIVDAGVNTQVFPENYIARAARMDSDGGMSNQTIITDTWSAVNLDNELAGSEAVLAAVNRLNIDASGDGEGWYLVNGCINVQATGAGVLWQVAIYVDRGGIGSYVEYSKATYYADTDHEANIRITDLIYLEKSDLVRLYCYHNAGVNRFLLAGSGTSLSGARLMTPVNEAWNR